MFALKTALSDIQNFGVCLFGENFVTPFSTLANIKGSLPTNLTTPDRLRCPTTTDGEDFPGFWVRTSTHRRKNKFFQNVRHLVVIYTPKEAHTVAGFS